MGVGLAGWDEGGGWVLAVSNGRINLVAQDQQSGQRSDTFRNSFVVAGLPDLADHALARRFLMS
jgi:hypothetical protein